MSKRRPTSERQAQLIEVTLTLLETTPLHQLSTRKIAAAAGISQPGLFRHFRSHEAVLLAAVDQLQGELEAAALHILEGSGAPLAKLEALGRALFALTTRHPGLPRLIFESSAGGPALRAALGELSSKPPLLATSLLRDAVSAGALPASVHPERGGRLFAVLVQGSLFQAMRAARSPDFAPMWQLFQAGLLAGFPTGPEAPRTLGEALALLDTRPLFAQGQDPLQAIEEAMAARPSDGALVVLAPFRPAPLIALHEQRGHRVVVEHQPPLWVIRVEGLSAPRCEDLRDLEPPEPMEAVLQAAAKLGPGESALVQTPRVPRLLFPRLRERGLSWSVVALPEGSALLHLRSPHGR